MIISTGEEIIIGAILSDCRHSGQKRHNKAWALLWLTRLGSGILPIRIGYKMNLKDYKSGQYKQQYEYQSFSPELISHEWDISDGEIQSLLSDAHRALGQLNAFSQLVPDIDFLS